MWLKLHTLSGKKIIVFMNHVCAIKEVDGASNILYSDGGAFKWDEVTETVDQILKMLE